MEEGENLVSEIYPIHTQRPKFSTAKIFTMEKMAKHALYAFIHVIFIKMHVLMTTYNKRCTNLFFRLTANRLPPIVGDFLFP